MLRRSSSSCCQLSLQEADQETTEANRELKLYQIQHPPDHIPPNLLDRAIKEKDTAMMELRQSHESMARELLEARRCSPTSPPQPPTSSFVETALSRRVAALALSSAEPSLSPLDILTAQLQQKQAELNASTRARDTEVARLQGKHEDEIRKLRMTHAAELDLQHWLYTTSTSESWKRVGIVERRLRDKEQENVELLFELEAWRRQGAQEEMDEEDEMEAEVGPSVGERLAGVFGFGSA